MLSKHFFYLLLLSFCKLTTTAAAKQSFPAVVKVKSFECAKPRGQSNEFGRSGILLKVKDAIYVVSGAHKENHAPRQANAPRKFCYEVTKDLSTKGKLTFKAANILKDLALYRIDDDDQRAFASSAMDIKNFDNEAAAVEHGELVDLVAYGYSSVADGSPNIYIGEVSDPQGGRTDADFDRAIEVDTTSEAGMTGGGLYKRNGVLAGLITSKGWNLVSQAEAVAVERDDRRIGLPRKQLVAAIQPLGFVLDWINDVERKTPGADLRLDPENNGVASLTMEDITLTEQNCINDGSGGHGIGIAGAPENDRHQREAGNFLNQVDVCHIKVTAAAQPSTQSWPFTSRRSFDYLRIAIKETKRDLYFLNVKKDDALIAIRSLNHALRLMKAGLLPALLAEKPLRIRGMLSDQKTYETLYNELTKDSKILEAAVEDFLKDFRAQDLNKETVDQFWNRLTPRRKLILYSAITYYGKDTAKDFFIKERSINYAIRLQKRWLSYVLNNKTEEFLLKASPEQQVWLFRGSKIIHETWLSLTKAQRKQILDSYQTNDGAQYFLISTMLFFGGSKAVLEEFDELIKPSLEAKITQWKKDIAAGNAEKVWADASASKRSVLYMISKAWYVDDEPELAAFMDKLCPALANINDQLKPVPLEEKEGDE